MSKKRPYLWLSWALAGVVAVAAFAFGAIDEAGPRTNAERTYDIAQTVKCPQCAGQSVAESDVAIARTIRAEIARQVDAGVADDAIRQSFIDQYGPAANLQPEADGLTGLVWVIPVLAIITAAALLGVAFWQWNGREVEQATDDDRRLVEEARSS